MNERVTIKTDGDDYAIRELEKLPGSKLKSRNGDADWRGKSIEFKLGETLNQVRAIEGNIVVAGVVNKKEPPYVMPSHEIIYEAVTKKRAQHSRYAIENCAIQLKNKREFQLKNNSPEEFQNALNRAYEDDKKHPMAMAFIKDMKENIFPKMDKIYWKRVLKYMRTKEFKNNHFLCDKKVQKIREYIDMVLRYKEK